MPNWNEQQLKAIQTKHKNILVSASAGAGKTTVLIARLVDLVLQDRISIDHILAMTFTEAAANEMKKRLAAELSALLQDPNHQEDHAYIAEQLSAISTAHISTIHSFCLSILQEFYYVIGLSAKRVNTIADPASIASLSELALDEVLMEEYAKNEEAFYQLTSMFSTRAESDEQLRSAILSLATQANAQSEPDAWLNRCEAMYQRYESIQSLPQNIQAFFFDDLRVQCDNIKEDLLFLQERFHTIYQEETKKQIAVDQKVEAFQSLYPALDAFDYTLFKETFLQQCHGVIPPAPDKEDNAYLRARKSILASEDALLERLFDESTLLKDLQDLAQPIHTLVSLSRSYQHVFAQYKEAQECIDFDDMEHFALAILKANDGQVAKHYQALFDEIMVDEFQDSNDVQNTLVNLIARDRNVFRVGDIKQSIYGFRHAKPQLMRGLIEHKQEQDEIIYLSNNYRSKKMIVDFNNILFKQLMNLDGFEGSYRKEDDVETGVPAQLEDNFPIIFHRLDAKAIKEDGDTIISNNGLKASYIANQIVEIREKEHRAWKDFVVLVRANARKDDLKQAFDEVGIPYFIDVKSGFYQSSAVQIILSTLRALLNPHDPISFAACMMSPLFKIQTQEYANITLQKEKDEDVYEAFLRLQHPIMERFENLRKQLYQIGICDMLTQLYETENYYGNHTTIQERTNLDLLFENATLFESEEGKGIFAFMKRIDAISNVQSGEAIPIGSEDDVVRVMSIHQSKGLQFPVVFLWSNSKQTPIEFKELFVCDSELGIGLKHMDLSYRFVRSTILRQAIEHKKDREELEEEMRILYVATTRAQQQMHMVDCVKPEEVTQSLSNALIYRRGGYTSWMLNATLEHHLFQTKDVTSAWETPLQELVQKQFIELPVYQEEMQTLSFITPSSLHDQDALPSFRFQTNEGFKHGTKMHQWIEWMGTTYANPTALFEAFPDVTKQDQYALCQLYENPVYQKANGYAEVYHELPFMVRKENAIHHGSIDFVAIDKEIILIDFKSDHKQADELLQLYASQLQDYAEALHVLYPGKVIHTYLYSLYLHRAIELQLEQVG